MRLDYVESLNSWQIIIEHCFTQVESARIQGQNMFRALVVQKQGREAWMKLHGVSSIHSTQQLGCIFEEALFLFILFFQESPALPFCSSTLPSHDLKW